MNRRESFHSGRLSKHSMRKESVSSIKSDMISESESYYDSFIQIKKEVSNYIIIDKKIYEKIIKFIKNSNLFKEQIKMKYNKKNNFKKPEYQNCLINKFSIISSNKNKNDYSLKSNNINNNENNNTDIKKDNIYSNINDNIKNNNTHSNINDNNVKNNNNNTHPNNDDNIKNNNTLSNNNDNNAKNNNINLDIKNNNTKNNNLDINNNIKKNNINLDINNNNNKIKTNSNTSMMSLFMNSQKEKAKEKEEISKLKSIISDMNKKHETEINNYKEIIKEFSNKIDSLQKELKKLKELNELLLQKENSKKQKIQIIFSQPKILSKILSYLENDEKFNLSKVSSYLYQNIYFKAVTEKIYKKLKKREIILENFGKEDLNSKFDVKENEIMELFKNYIIEQKVSGKEMRNEIVKSLIFLETNVKIPMNNFKGPLTEKDNISTTKGPKKEIFLTKFFSKIKSEFEEELENYSKSENLVKSNYITFSQNEFNNLFAADKHVLETFQTDKSLNIKFEYKNSNKIKDIINEFFLCQLPQPSYQKFIQKICETFCDLLYSSFLALNDIKNLQIIAFSLYSRYMKFKLKNEELLSVIEDLNHFADSNRQIKEMLTKSKNELEFKYTNSKMTISQLNNIIIEKEKEINNIKSKAKEKEEKYDKFKIELVKEYQKIKDDFVFTKNERDTLKGVLIELKDFFVKVVTGELLN